MSEGRKVVCPWCGGDMEPACVPTGYAGCGARYYCPKCDIDGPFGGWRDTEAEAIAAAYFAATATPPNRPLIREQVEAMPDLAAVWCVWMGKTTVCDARKAREQHLVWIDDGEIFFAAPPTPADIAAARAGKGEENE